MAKLNTLAWNLMNIRHKGYWIADFIKGSKVKKHLKEITFQLERASIASQNKLRSKDLSNLLIHAASTTPFFSNYRNHNNIAAFPVINKGMIREKSDLFLSSKYSKKDLVSTVTSGSTGTPFKTFQDKNKRNRNFADNIYFSAQAGYEIGYRLLYLKIWAQQNMKSKLAYKFQNIIPVDVLCLTDKEIKNLVNNISSRGSKYCILGYASSLETICQYLDKNNYDKLDIDVRSIIAISESLNQYTKVAMEKYFGAPVYSRYSNLENGIIAQQTSSNSEKFRINTASYHVEILEMDSDLPAKEGELGRIIITDLFNYGMPMIRYDTGDIGAIEKNVAHPNECYFIKLEGRKMDLIFNTRGEPISSFIPYKNMWQYTEIKQYQLIQEGLKRYTFKINSEGRFMREKQLIDEFKTYLGSDAEFIIEYVDEIPLLSSGKRKKIVNNYKSGN